MSDIGSRLKRVIARGEGWLPLLAFGGAAWLFVVAGTVPESVEAADRPAAQAAAQPEAAPAPRDAASRR